MIIKLTIIAIASIIFFKNINNFPLRNWDEAWYAEIIKNMASGNYQILMPFWNGRYYFDHAPLYFWLSLPIVKLFGLGDWQVRFVSAISAILATYLVFLIGKHLKNTQTGIFSALVFLTLGQVVIRFAHGNLDSLLVTLSVASFYFYLKSEQKKFFAIACGLAIGLGILVKSWGTGLFPLLIIFSYATAKTKSLPKNLPIIITVSLISFGWWYLWGIANFKDEFINWYLLNPTENRLNNLLQGFNFNYFHALFRDIGFWFVPIAVFAILVKKIRTLPRTVFVSFSVTSLLYIFFLNFLKDKSDWYNLPAYPQVAILIGIIVAQIYKRFPKVTLILVAAITAAQIFNIQWIENLTPDRSTVGASLGIHANNIIPGNSLVIFDDHDFTAFLYYSNQKAIYTIEDDMESPETEWWKVKRSDLEQFTKSNKNVWIVTPNPDNLPVKIEKNKIKSVYNGYSFAKLE